MMVGLNFINRKLMDIYQQWSGDLKRGDKNALACLFENFKQDVYLFAYTYFREKEAAEEIVQDTFIRIWEKRSYINPTLNIKNYILKVAKNLIIDELRKVDYKLNHTKEIHFLSSDVHEDTQNAIFLSDYQALVKRAMNELPPKRKEIFNLSREKHMSYADISNHLGISVNVVENQMSKALKHMRKYLRVYADIAVVLLTVLYFTA